MSEAGYCFLPALALADWLNQPIESRLFSNCKLSPWSVSTELPRAEVRLDSEICMRPNDWPSPEVVGTAGPVVLPNVDPTEKVGPPTTPPTVFVRPPSKPLLRLPDEAGACWVVRLDRAVLVACAPKTSSHVRREARLYRFPIALYQKLGLRNLRYGGQSNEKKTRQPSAVAGNRRFDWSVCDHCGYGKRSTTNSFRRPEGPSLGL